MFRSFRSGIFSSLGKYAQTQQRRLSAWIKYAEDTQNDSKKVFLPISSGSRRHAFNVPGKRGTGEGQQRGNSDAAFLAQATDQWRSNLRRASRQSVPLHHRGYGRPAYAFRG